MPVCLHSGGTGWTDPEKKNLMILDDKTIGHGFLFVQAATRQLVYPVATVAMEMMVMAFIRTFVQGPQNGVIELFEPALADEQFEIAVHRRLIERPNLRATSLKNFFNGHGAIFIEEYPFDGSAL